MELVAIENYKSKDSVVVVFTGEGKGKTSASLGLMSRALGSRMNVAFVQFIKYWGVSEHVFIHDIIDIYGDQLYFYKGGKGFYNAGDMSAKNISKKQHVSAAKKTLAEAIECASSGKYQLVICDELSNAVHDGLLSIKDLEKLIDTKHAKCSLCITGRNFPKKLLDKVDIATDMKKIKHHFDDDFIANQGIDY